MQLVGPRQHPFRDQGSRARNERSDPRPSSRASAPSTESRGDLQYRTQHRCGHGDSGVHVVRMTVTAIGVIGHHDTVNRSSQAVRPMPDGLPGGIDESPLTPRPCRPYRNRAPATRAAKVDRCADPERSPRRGESSPMQ